MHTIYDDDSNLTIPHVTRHDNIKVGLYALVGLGITIALIAGTVWLFVAG